MLPPCIVRLASEWSSALAVCVNESSDVPPLITVASILRNTAVYGAPYRSIIYASYELTDDFNVVGECHQVSVSEYALFPEAKTFDLSTLNLVPPFHVE